MSMVERFPDFDLSLPDWLQDAPDTAFEPSDLARRAALQDLRTLDPLAHAPSAVDLHLEGPELKSGAVSSGVAELFGLFQAEVNAASDSDDERWTTMSLVGSSPGSVVLHLAPIAAEEKPTKGETFAIPGGRIFDVAVGRVMDLHETFENQRGIDTKKVKRPLREAARKFIEALDTADVTVRMDVFNSEGSHRRSALGRRGRQFAVTQFAPVESSGVELIFGELQSVDLDGRIVIRGRGGPRAADEVATASGGVKRRRIRKFEISGVPIDQIRAGRLVPGQSYGVEVVDNSAVDPMNTRTRDEFHFLGLASLDAIDPDRRE